MSKLRIEHTGPMKTRVWLDGVELTRSLSAITVEIDRDSFPEAWLTIRPDEIEIDADTLAYLTAYMKEREQPRINIVGRAYPESGDAAVVRCPQCGESQITGVSERGEPFRYQCGNCDHFWRA